MSQRPGRRFGLHVALVVHRGSFSSFKAYPYPRLLRYLIVKYDVNKMFPSRQIAHLPRPFQSPLHQAARENVEAIHLLAAAGAHLNAESALIGHCKRYPLGCAGGNIDNVRALLAWGADPNIGHKSKHMSPFIWLIEHRHGEHLVRLMLESGADPNQRNQLDYTPLHLEIVGLEIGGNPTIVELLLEFGADPHAKTCYGDKPNDIGYPQFRPKVTAVLERAMNN